MTPRKAMAVITMTCAAALAAPVAAGAHSTSVKHAATTPAATQVSSLKDIPVTGTGRHGKDFTGHMTVSQFVSRGGRTYAVGILTGRVGHRAIKETVVALPASVTRAANGSASASATCPVLHLVLGPLNLNVLGLHVTLNQVVLDITAQSGPGNLLGNLVCSVANLLNNQSILGQELSGLLNLVNTLLGTPGLLKL